MSTPKPPTNFLKSCVFCGKEDDDKRYGEMMSDEAGLTAHNFCLLFSSGLAQQGDDSEGLVGFLADDIIKEQRRSRHLKCVYCKRQGASVGCGNIRCKKSYHYGCGKDHAAMYLYCDDFRSYCKGHRQKQTDLTREERIEFETKTTDTCYICYENVETKICETSVLAPCCTRAWYHRTCLDDMAYSAGIHFFKCPLCNNFEEWQNEMLKAGLYIPDRDASWELVPDAYNSLLETNIECEAETCLCPRGRKEDRENSEWELILCETCGSQACHTICGKLRPQDSEWLCKVCRDAPGNAPPSHVTTRSEAGQNTSEEMSEDAGTSSQSLGNESSGSDSSSNQSHRTQRLNSPGTKTSRKRKYVKNPCSEDQRKRENRQERGMHDVTNIMLGDASL